MGTVLIRNARIATMGEQGDLESADILIRDGAIVAVGRGLEVNPGASGAETIDASGMLAIPGMADTHTHLWEGLFRGRMAEAWGIEYFNNIPQLGSWVTPQDMYAGVYDGAIELLNAGVTSVLDFCHAINSPEHADAAAEALRASGIRALLAYDLEGRDPAERSSYAPSAARFDEAVRLAKDAADKGSLVRVGIGLSGVTPERADRNRTEIEFARAHGLRMTFHNNRGGELVLLDRAGLMGPDILPVHSNMTTDEDLDALASCGALLTTQPEAETYAGRRPYSMVGRAHKRGVRVALGVDVPCLVNPSILTQMRLLYLLQRYMDGVHERYEAHLPVARRDGWPQLTVRDVLRFGTTNGAAAIGLEGQVGQIAVGQQADIVLIDARTFGMAEGDPAAHVVMTTSEADVHTVLVAGEFRKRDGQLVGVDREQMSDAREQARSRVLAAAGDLGAGPLRQTWHPMMDETRMGVTA